MSPLRNPPESNTCVAPVPRQFKGYKRNFSFMSRFVGYHVFADAPQLLKVPSLMLKSSSDRIQRLRGAFACQKSNTIHLIVSLLVFHRR